MEWPLTFRCNNNCISCILDTRQMKNLGEPFMEQIRDVIDKVPESEILGFTGGEPTLRKEFFEILRYARERHPEKFLFVVSNGRRFASEEFTKKLADLNLGNFRLGIALYSHKAHVHDEITEVKGSWREAVLGIKNLLKHGIRVELRILVERPNYLEMEGFANFIVDNFKGLERVVFINLKYTGNAFINRKKIFVRYSKAAPFVEKAADILLENSFKVKLFHFPLCIIDRKHWELAEGVTKQKSELTLLKRCEFCAVKERCPRIWKSYLPLAGDKEFRPILRSENI